MTACDQLREEHQGIRIMLQIMEAIGVRLRNGETVSTEDLDNIIAFLSGFADRCHHGKEEKLLFPALEQIDGITTAFEVADLLDEHTQGREYIENIKDGIFQYKNASEEANNIIAAAIDNYVDLLNRHIQKEDGGVFVTADTSLPPEKQIELLAGFEEIEEKEIGVGKHEEYHKLLEEIKGRYL